MPRGAYCKCIYVQFSCVFVIFAISLSLFMVEFNNVEKIELLVSVTTGLYTMQFVLILHASWWLSKCC